MINPAIMYDGILDERTEISSFGKMSEMGSSFGNIQGDFFGRIANQWDGKYYDFLTDLKLYRDYVRKELQEKGMEGAKVEYRLYISGVTYYHIKQGIKDYEIDSLTDFKKGQEEVIFYVWLPNEEPSDIYGHKVINLWEPETSQNSDSINY